MKHGERNDDRGEKGGVTMLLIIVAWFCFHGLVVWNDGEDDH